MARKDNGLAGRGIDLSSQGLKFILRFVNETKRPLDEFRTQWSSMTTVIEGLMKKTSESIAKIVAGVDIFKKKVNDEEQLVLPFGASKKSYDFLDRLKKKIGEVGSVYIEQLNRARQWITSLWREQKQLSFTFEDSAAKGSKFGEVLKSLGNASKNLGKGAMKAAVPVLEAAGEAAVVGSLAIIGGSVEAAREVGNIESELERLVIAQRGTVLSTKQVREESDRWVESLANIAARTDTSLEELVYLQKELTELGYTWDKGGKAITNFGADMEVVTHVNKLAFAQLADMAIKMQGLSEKDLPKLGSAIDAAFTVGAGSFEVITQLLAGLRKSLQYTVNQARESAKLAGATDEEITRAGENAYMRMVATATAASQTLQKVGLHGTETVTRLIDITRDQASDSFAQLTAFISRGNQQAYSEIMKGLKENNPVPLLQAISKAAKTENKELLPIMRQLYESLGLPLEDVQSDISQLGKVYDGFTKDLVKNSKTILEAGKSNARYEEMLQKTAGRWDMLTSRVSRFAGVLWTDLGLNMKKLLIPLFEKFNSLLDLMFGKEGEKSPREENIHKLGKALFYVSTAISAIAAAGAVASGIQLIRLLTTGAVSKEATAVVAILQSLKGGGVIDVVAAFFSLMTSSLRAGLGLIGPLVTGLRSLIVPIVAGIAQLTGLTTLVEGLAVMLGLNPFTIWITGLIALGASIYIFRKDIGNLFSFVGQWIDKTVHQLKVLKQVWNYLWDTKFLPKLEGWANEISDFVTSTKKEFSDLWDSTVAGYHHVIDAAAAIGKSLVDLLVPDFLQREFIAFFDKLSKIISTWASSIKAKLADAFSPLNIAKMLLPAPVRDAITGAQEALNAVSENKDIHRAWIDLKKEAREHDKKTNREPKTVEPTRQPEARMSEADRRRPIPETMVAPKQPVTERFEGRTRVIVKDVEAQVVTPPAAPQATPALPPADTSNPVTLPPADTSTPSSVVTPVIPAADISTPSSVVAPEVVPPAPASALVVPEVPATVGTTEARTTMSPQQATPAPKQLPANEQASRVDSLRKESAVSSQDSTGKKLRVDHNDLISTINVTSGRMTEEIRQLGIKIQATNISSEDSITKQFARTSL